MKRRHPRPGLLHQDWLVQVETEGPFLSRPVVKDIWPNGMDRLGDTDERLVTFKESHALWERAFDERASAPEKYSPTVRSWVDTVLDDLAEWRGLRVDLEELPDNFVVRSPGDTITIRPDGALTAREKGGFACLWRHVPPTESLHAEGVDGWSANEIDRMAALLRKSAVSVGVVTDGRWWGLVWAGEGTTVGSGIVDALTWRDERELRDAFLTLINASTFRTKNPDRRLPRLFERSVLEAEEITEALGVQVRKSVELIVQAFSEARLSARTRELPDPLCDEPDEVYQAAVTLMMRVVFLLFAEERGMLPTPELYRVAYGVSELLDDLQARADQEGEENLDHSSDVWHRLIAVSAALYGGSNFDEARMPAYGGSLFDPSRFAWMSAERDDGGLRLRVSDRVMLHVFKSVQVAHVAGEARRISFRDVDVEQIGYIYEGLLGYTCRTVKDQAILGLHGKAGEEPEIDLDTLDELDDASRNATEFAGSLTAWVKQTQPAAKLVSITKLAKAYISVVDEAEMKRLLLPVAGGDEALLDGLIYWANLIRRDLRGLPYVVPLGGLIVAETPSRKNAGAHYTPRSLAEEVVLHALQPLVYEPGPLQTNDQDTWKLKSSSAILDLKVADIAAGSGAFLVAAARFLADRLVEAWVAEGIAQAQRVGEIQNLAIREVIARCLYGADINGMAVEMCKLSLWLVSLDPLKPFSFVDDKIFHGNSLLGVTTLDQLRYLHIAPESKKSKDINAFVDVDALLAEATRIRHTLASSIDEDEPQRSRNGKRRLLVQLQELTAKLRLIADAIVATGLRCGGRPGGALDAAYSVLEGRLMDAFPADGSARETSSLENLIVQGLTPTVPTDYVEWKPLHWLIEAPDVVIEHGGFDAAIGNPPFLGDTKLPAAIGGNAREYLSHQIARMPGRVDLVTYFLLRAAALLRPNGSQLGLITTNTIAQGITREVGLDQLVANGWQIRRALRSEKWPSRSAALEFAAIWCTNKPIAQTAVLVLDRSPTKSITTLLEPGDETRESPRRLRENRGIAYQGTGLLGKGFILTPHEAEQMIARSSKNAAVVRRFMIGDNLNNRPDSSAARYVIDFGERTESQARAYTEPWSRVERLVRPERIKQDGLKYPRMVHEWWKFWNPRLALYAAISSLDAVIAIARVSKSVMPVRVPTGQVFSEQCIVFAAAAGAEFAVLSSTIHQTWAITYGSTLETRVRYTPSDVFETFPRPQRTEPLELVGGRFDAARREVMQRRQLGLTALYNLVNDPRVQGDGDVLRMRELHVEVDEATMSAFGWSDLSLCHGFHAYRKMERFTMSPAARVEVLDRLLRENHRRARAEGQKVQDEGGLV